MSCPVCIEPFNRSNRKPVRCLNKDCDFMACRVCYRRYLVSTIEEAHCMACKQTWDVHFLYSQFTKKFVNDTWWVHRVRCMVDREKSLLPNAMRYVKMIKQLYSLKSEVGRLRADIEELYMQNEDSSTDTETKSTIDMLIAEKNAQMMNYYNEINNHMFNNDPYLTSRRNIPRDEDDSIHYVYGYLLNNGTLEEKKVERFTWPCPQTKCRGFLDSKFYCSLCHTRVCSKCHVILGVGEGKTYRNHTCKEDDIKSIAQKKKNTCSCPRCNVLIYRISGCNQMWCTQCYTPFDFKTREIITGRIHNPHYFDYLYDNPSTMAGHENTNREIMRCRIDYTRMYTIFKRYHLRVLKSVCYRTTHYQDVANSYVYRRDTIPYKESNMVLRVKYLLGEISEDEWLLQIKTNERYRLFFSAIIPIYVTWSETCRDCVLKIQQFQADQKTEDYDSIKHHLLDQLIQIIELTRLSNEQLHKIMLCYHVSCELIDLNGYRYNKDTNTTSNVEKQLNEYIYMYTNPKKHRKRHILLEKSVKQLKHILYTYPSKSFRAFDYAHILCPSATK